jgi:hypothetical protein
MISQYFTHSALQFGDIPEKTLPSTELVAAKIMGRAAKLSRSILLGIRPPDL